MEKELTHKPTEKLKSSEKWKNYQGALLSKCLILKLKIEKLKSDKLISEKEFNNFNFILEQIENLCKKYKSVLSLAKAIAFCKNIEDINRFKVLLKYDIMQIYNDEV